MNDIDTTNGHGARGLSRRVLLQAAAASVAGVMSAGTGLARPRSGLRAYIGTYAPKGQGIYRIEVDADTGRAGDAVLAAATPSPSWLALDSAQRVLYAVNEVADFNGGTSGSLSAFAVDAAGGGLHPVNSVSSGGAIPVHLGLHPSGRFMLAANYGSGSVAVLPLRGDGGLVDATDLKQDADACGLTPCQPGPDHAVKAPPGSFAVSDHDAPHAHMAAFDASGRFAIVNDLGLDRTIVWRFDERSGKLSQPRSVSASAGAGPRHFVFHPNGRWFYSINEEASTIAFMTWDATSGMLTPQDEVQTLPASFTGTSFASEILLSPDGRTLYGLNRLHDSIAIFTLDAQGRPHLVAEEWTRGSYPRSASIDPSGRLMLVCNQRSDNVAAFRIDGHRLHFGDQYIACPSPAVVAFAG
jgi:6-phosphogluconolactonase